MRVTAAFLALNSAAAVAPPRIELNLEGMTSAYKLKTSVVRNHDLGYVQNNADKVVSRQDWTEKCAAKRKCATGDNCGTGFGGTWVTTDNTNCPFPNAKGYDHQDKKVEVTTRVFLVDTDGAACSSDCEKAAVEVDFTKRSTYLFKYDASDMAGNHAEQVVFALILDDAEAPFFNKNCESGSAFQSAITVEAVSDWELCQLEAVDNVDAKIDATTYRINYISRDHAAFQGENVKTDSKCTQGDPKYAGVSKKFQSYAAANKWMTTFGLQNVGKYLITLHSEDEAGVYGHNAANNERKQKQAVLIQDRVQPTIYLAGHDPQYVECNKEGKGRKISEQGTWDFEAFEGMESDCKDQLDTVALKQYLPVTTTISGTSVSNVFGDCDGPGKSTHDKEIAQFLAHPAGKTHTLDYTCNDRSNNAAALVTRTIKTVDTHQPSLHLVHENKELIGETTHVVIYSTSEGEHSFEPNAQDSGNAQIWAEDSCDKTIDTDDVTFSWGPRAFNAKILGDYIRTYTVSDATGNVAFKTRTYSVVDNSKPSQIMVGGNEIIEATRDNEYTDKGATCHDIVDGELSHAVEVSGEVVNLRIPGTYTINYNCQDLSGNAADEETRTVTVKDTTCPEVTLIGTDTNYVESGFPYIDAGATATDTLDGDITQYIWTDGNTVDTSKAFYAMRSCQAIKKQFQQTLKQGGVNGVKQRSQFDGDGNAHAFLNNGRYVITVQLPDGTFKRDYAHCFFGAANDYAYSYRVHDLGANRCRQWGMQHMNWNKVAKPLQKYINTLDSKIAKKIGDKNYYLCQINPSTDDDHMKGISENSKAEWTNDANAGKYIIQFNVEDKQGNAQCDAPRRTVTVRDTLPPVITLTLNNKLVHQSKGDQVGIDHHRIGGAYNAAYPNRQNPAGYAQAPAGSPAAYAAYGNPNMMAESTSTNGWLIGAAASAVAGVALLGFSSRKATTSVPV